MVIVKLIGGLGNQLFQYAVGLQLAMFHQTVLKLDKEPFEQYKLHQYSLAPFAIKESFASPEDVAALTGTTKKGLILFFFKVQRKLKPYYRRTVIRETTLSLYDPNIFKTPRNVYLDGYWQSEKYFANIQDIIRSHFTVKLEQDSLSRQLATQIAQTQSVSLHIRRGDYVTNPRTNQVHGTVCLSYYHECVEHIAKRISSPHFFVFSDDHTWTTENLHLDYPVTFVTHNDASRNYEDLRLMSSCKHHIIANSSFSWWGAWLNPNPNKLVFAPAKWANDPSMNTRDLLPDGWRTV